MGAFLEQAVPTCTKVAQRWGGWELPPGQGECAWLGASASIPDSPCQAARCFEQLPAELSLRGG